MNNLLQLMHDTISPVARIKGAVTVLKSGTLSPGDVDMILDIILVSSDNLNQVIDSYYIRTNQLNEDIVPVCKVDVFLNNDNKKLEEQLTQKQNDIDELVAELENIKEYGVNNLKLEILIQKHTNK